MFLDDGRAEIDNNTVARTPCSPDQTVAPTTGPCAGSRHQLCPALGEVGTALNQRRSDAQAIVLALARKILVAFWECVTNGVVVDGAPSCKPCNGAQHHPLTLVSFD